MSIVDSIGTGDFNGDGVLDVAVTQCGYFANGAPPQCLNGNAGILLGNGNGTFQSEVVYGPNPASDNSAAIAVADVNGDGKLDFAVANESSGTVSLYLGKGDGTFQSGGNYGIGYTGLPISGGFYPPVSLLLADFNGDGMPDLVTTNFYDDTINLSFSKGGRGFLTYMNYSIQAVLYPAQLVGVADFNGDHKQDLVLVKCSNLNNNGNAYCTQSSVSLSLGNGDGTFQSPLDTIAGTINPSAASIGDFNGDGKLDVAVAGYCDNFENCNVGELSVLLGNGDGTFTQGVAYSTQAIYSVADGDFNGDGKLDLATTTCQNGCLLSVWLGNGDGTFQTSMGVASELSILAQGDVNGDGRLDLVVLNANNNGAVGILLGNGDGTFHKEVDYPAGLRSIGASVAIGDLNGDGRPDLVVGDSDDAACTGSEVPNCGISVLLGNGDGTFQTAMHFVTEFGPGSVSLGDFNGDGILDIVATIPGLQNQGNPDPVVSVFLGNGDGTFQSNQDYGVGLSPHFAAVADYNGDGRLDLAVDASGTVDAYGNGVNIVLNAVPGTFQDFTLSSSATKPDSISAGQSATSIITLSSLTGFNSSVSLTCSVAPASSSAPTCSLSPSSVTPLANGSATSTLTMSTMASSSELMNTRQHDSRPLYALWLSIPALALIGAGASSNRSRGGGRLRLMLVLVTFFGLGFQSACGGGGSSPGGGGSAGTLRGNYTIVIAATSGTLTHKVITTLTVK